MNHSVKREMKMYRLGQEGLSKFSTPLELGYFNQIFIKRDYKNPILNKIMHHYMWNFSGQIFGILIWLAIMAIGFGFKSLIIFIIPLSGLLSILLMFWILKIGGR
ncbi:MAG: hypothetical protein JXR88_16770 [Clostridia bacterium]|nr:hypothetical protein [Clostridia bacterium]